MLSSFTYAIVVTAHIRVLQAEIPPRNQVANFRCIRKTLRPSPNLLMGRKSPPILPPWKFPPWSGSEIYDAALACLARRQPLIFRLKSTIKAVSHEIHSGLQQAYDIVSLVPVFSVVRIRCDVLQELVNLEVVDCEKQRGFTTSNRRVADFSGLVVFLSSDNPYSSQFLNSLHFLLW